jgi:hypothetical protein
VAEACLRGDSGARQRLFEWTVSSPVARVPAEEALMDVWRLWASEDWAKEEGEA